MEERKGNKAKGRERKRRKGRRLQEEEVRR
jgi:hypothetical protein